MLIVNSVFIEPVIDGGFEINVIAEVAGTSRGGEELRLFGDGVSAIHFFIGAGIVL